MYDWNQFKDYPPLSDDDHYIETFISVIKGCSAPFDEGVLSIAIEKLQGAGGRQSRHELWNTAKKGMQLAQGVGLLTIDRQQYYPTERFARVMMLGRWYDYKVQLHLGKINEPMINIDNSKGKTTVYGNGNAVGNSYSDLRNLNNAPTFNPIQTTNTSFQKSFWHKASKKVLNNAWTIISAIIIAFILSCLGIG